jgi:ABC-type multidrug transport system, ATPase component
MVNINNLNFSYSNTPVFSGLTMKLEAGKIYGLLGQNGVGKTTLLKIMAGLLKVDPNACTIPGWIPFERKPGFLSDMYFIPEDFVGPDTVVNQYAKLRGEFYPKYDENKFKMLLSEFEVDGTKKFTKLSFGQQKKAILSFALSTNTKLLLMDEPSNGLDIPSKTQFRKAMSQSANDESCIVISTHQVRDLENLIDPIVILDNNGLILNESIERISEKLSFRLSTKIEEHAIYNEPTLGGYVTVEENYEKEESKVSLEALFNATLQNKEKIMNLFNN